MKVECPVFTCWLFKERLFRWLEMFMSKVEISVSTFEERLSEWWLEVSMSEVELSDIELSDIEERERERKRVEAEREMFRIYTTRRR